MSLTNPLEGLSGAPKATPTGLELVAGAGSLPNPPNKPLRGSIVSLEDPSFKYRFLLNPEAFPDRKGSNYAETPIPGISHPIMSWSHGTARELDIDLLLTRDISNPPVAPGLLQKIGTKLLGTAFALASPGLPFQPNSKDPLASLTGAANQVPVLGNLIGAGAHVADPNVFANTFSILPDVLVLRSFLYPDDNATADLNATSPHRILFNYGPYYNNMMCVMTKCDIEWKAWEQNLIPIRAVVRMTFKELIYNNITRDDVLKGLPSGPPSSLGAGGSSILGTIGSAALGVAVIGAAVIASKNGAAVGGLGGSFGGIGGFSQQFGKK